MALTGGPGSGRPDRLVHVPAEECSGGTAQTGGMRRLAAISGRLTGSRNIWMGVTTVEPRASSRAHHHGSSETAIYVVYGNPVFIYRSGDEEVRLRTKPGDFVYVPPFVPHVESNAESGDEAVVVIARTTQEAIVENLPGL
jgi:uncharacterized RmlC-like cupin family protein